MTLTSILAALTLPPCLGVSSDTTGPAICISLPAVATGLAWPLLRLQAALRQACAAGTTPAGTQGAELWREDENQWAHIWQARFYDFNVWTRRKQVEKLRYMHENPVKRGLVLEPGQWAWSSFRDYAQNHPDE